MRVFIFTLMFSFSAFLLMFLPTETFAEEALKPLSPAYDAGASQDTVLDLANNFYKEGEVEEALEGYLYLSHLNLRNGHLFYNIGNTYFRLGELGKAMLWYERALDYIPRFRDLRVNYNYARSALTDEEFKAPDYSGTMGFLFNLYRSVNLRESLLISVFLFWITALLSVLLLFVDHPRLRSLLRIPCWVIGFAFILLCLSSAYKLFAYEQISEGIIMAQAVDIKTGPRTDFSTSFTLHEGTKVILTQQEGDWMRIVLPHNQNFTGWMPRQEVEKI